jgi:hypothetical protein
MSNRLLSFAQRVALTLRSIVRRLDHWWMLRSVTRDHIEWTRKRDAYEILLWEANAMAAFYGEWRAELTSDFGSPPNTGIERPCGRKEDACSNG